MLGRVISRTLRHIPRLVNTLTRNAHGIQNRRYSRRVRLWKFLSARAIAKALSEEPYNYPVSEDVVQKWKRRNKIDPRAEDKVLDLLGIKKEAPGPKAEGSNGLVTLRDDADERRKIALEAAVEGQEAALRVIVRLLERVAGTPLEGELRDAMLDVLGTDDPRL